MNSTIEKPLVINKKFQVSVVNGDILFMPIKEDPLGRNFYLLETSETHMFDVEKMKFLPTKTVGTLLNCREGVCYKLNGFRTKTIETLMEKVAEKITNRYLGLS
jgi:hypothetical protein